MNFDQENTASSKSAITTEQEKKDWTVPQLREFAIGQVTTHGNVCANDGTNSS